MIIYNLVNIIPKFLLIKSPILDFGIPIIMIVIMIVLLIYLLLCHYLFLQFVPMFQI